MSFYEVVGTLVVTVILVAVPGICVFAHIYNKRGHCSGQVDLCPECRESFKKWFEES